MPPTDSRALEPIILDCYDAGLLSDYGGGNVEWWQDYIRAELARAHDHYQAQFDAATSAAPQSDGWISVDERLPAHEQEVAIDRESLIDLIEENLYGVYHCGRVWEAWHVGTMSQDDFTEARGSELAPDLADAIIAKFAASPEAAPAAMELEQFAASQQSLGVDTGDHWQLYDTSPAATPAAPSAVTLSHEHDIALREGYQIRACEDYFSARSKGFHTIYTVTAYEAGFKKGWEDRAVLAQPAPVQAGAQQAVADMCERKYPSNPQSSILSRAAPTQAGAGDAKAIPSGERDL